MKTILFVDDDSRILKSANFYFKNQYNVLVAENTADAFNILNNQSVDVIVSDFGMMGGNGVDFKSKINESVHKEIPFIVVSGEIGKESSIKFANLKVEKIIEKPMDLGQLDLVLKDIIKQSENKQNEKKMSFIGKNTGQIIHDINNSLGIIMMSSDMGQSVKEQTDKVQMLFSKSKKACSKISEIITKYKSLANNKEISLKEYSVNYFEDYLEKELKDFALGNRVDIKIERCYSQQTISLDLLLLCQAFLNLMSNAKDAINDARRVGEIKVNLNVTDKTLFIKINDNGMGIPEHIKNHLFEEQNSSKGDKGTGMGLTYCKKVIDLHLGKIWLSNTSTAGTEFCINLPLTEKDVL